MLFFDEKFECLKQFGVNGFINYNIDFDWGQKVLELMDGKGVDIVIEVGGLGILLQLMNVVIVGGLIGFIGVLSGIEGEVSLLLLVVKGVIM